MSATRIAKLRVHVTHTGLENIIGKDLSRSEETETDYKTAVKKALDKSTVTALCQINATPRRAVKAFWICLLGLGMALSVLQIYEIIQKYTRYQVVEKKSVELQFPVQFPAVTLCSNAPLGHKSADDIGSLIPSSKFTDHLKKIQGEFSYGNYVKSLLLEQQLLLAFLSNLKAAQRTQMGLNISDFVLFCEHGDTIKFCMDKLILINLLFFGNCATYNAGLPAKNSSHRPLEKENMLFMFINFVESMDVKSFLRNKAMVLEIHEPGTPPIMRMTKIIKIYPGEFLEISITKRDFIRQKDPYVTQCIERDSVDSKWLSLYHEDELPYLYSSSACEESCIQNLSQAHCNCFNPMVPIRDVSPNQRACHTGCDSIPQSEFINMCGCKKECRNSEYDVTILKNPKKFTEGKFAQFIKSVTEIGLLNVTGNDVKNLAGFSISLGSNLVEVVKEEPLLKTEDLLASIGGILGIWVGMSFLSLVEVFIGFGEIFMVFLRHLCSSHK